MHPISLTAFYRKWTKPRLCFSVLGRVSGPLAPGSVKSLTTDWTKTVLWVQRNLPAERQMTDIKLLIVGLYVFKF